MEMANSANFTIDALLGTSRLQNSSVEKDSYTLKGRHPREFNQVTLSDTDEDVPQQCSGKLN